MISFGGNSGGDGTAGLGALGRGLTPFVSGAAPAATYAPVVGLADNAGQSEFANSGLSAYDYAYTHAADVGVTGDPGLNEILEALARSSYESGYAPPAGYRGVTEGGEETYTRFEIPDAPGPGGRSPWGKSLNEQMLDFEYGQVSTDGKYLIVPERMVDSYMSKMWGPRESFLAPSEFALDYGKATNLSSYDSPVRASWEDGTDGPTEVSWNLSGGGLVGSPDAYADGGEVSGMPEDDVTKEEAALVQGAIAALSPESNMTPEERKAILLELENVFGEGAVEALMAEMQNASGKSDGRSDSIPAVVNGVQPAALSEGEFVVPADVVSDIGRGSTQSGARELQGVIDMIRSKRGSGPQQAQPVNAPAMLSAGR